MTKISKEKKIKAIHDYLNSTKSQRAIALEYGITPGLFTLLIGIFKLHGEDGILNSPHITGEFRVNTVIWKQQNNASISETAIHFAIPGPGQVSSWDRMYKRYGTDALLNMRKGRPKHDRQIKSTIGGGVEAAARSQLILADTKQFLKKIGSLETATKREIAQAICELKAKYHYRLVDMITALPISMSTFQYWNHKFKEAIDPDVEIKTMIQSLWEKHKERYGVRRIYKELRKTVVINHKKVQRLMREMRLKCVKFSKSTRKYNSYAGNKGGVVKNVLNRRFKANRPYQKLVCDVTEFKVATGEKLYLEPIIDLFSNRVISYSIGRHPDLEFSLAPLQELVSTIPETGYRVILHTDQGGQYQHKDWRKLLKCGRIKQSMSKKATCADNAACESFFGKLKAEVGPAKDFESIQELWNELIEYIYYYNNERLQIKLKSLSPIEYEQQAV